MNYYNLKDDNIIYLKSNADANFWDEVWNEEINWVDKYTKSLGADSKFVKFIQSYVPLSGRILEAGCGRGQFVYALSLAGYDVLGIDYAEKTVKTLNEQIPEINVQLGDITDLNAIEDSSYDAYYSGGVIEHFWDGYDKIISEAHRVLKKDGILIITFPFMSNARKRKKKFLPIWENDFPPEGFYQFALNLESTITNIKLQGFNLIHKKLQNGTRGFIDNHPNFPIISSIYKNKSKNIFRKIFLKVADQILSLFGFAHTTKLVFSKKK